MRFPLTEKWRKSDTLSDKEVSAGQNYYDPDLAHPDTEFDDEHVPVPDSTTERRLMTKIDLRLIPALSILYLLAFLDRTNIANAQVFGLIPDLGLTGNQYNTALTVFFVPYVIFEIPSNIILKRLKPHVWLSFCMFLFGLVTICQGLVQNFSGLVATRFFLGLAETGMFPGCFYLIGMWYRRAEAQKRYSFFFSSTTLAGAFGGLLASAIGKMDHMQSYRGWRWVFILEGVLTCVISFIFFFLLPDFPEDAKWLTPSERAYIQSRLRADQYGGSSSNHNTSSGSGLARRITTRDVLNVFKDYKIFVGGLMYFGLIVPAYSYAFFAPGIIQSYGYSPIQTQLHSVPPWAAAFGFAMLVAYFSDRFRHRFAFCVIPICVAITGFAILLATHHNRPLQYGALFMVTCGTYGAMPVVVCWFNMNLGGHHRRAVGTAWQIGFGNIGGIIATYAFLKTDAPEYRKGYGICEGFIGLSLLSCVVYLVGVVWENRRRERSVEVVGGVTEWEKVEKGDLSRDYRYMI
ncbi:MAG: hypothetical protein Q9160_001435 [Pyrenula sp. 1 TL-2023]